jgi:hypothetical protein
MNTPECTSTSSASVNARRKEHGDNLPKLMHVMWPQMSKMPKGDPQYSIHHPLQRRQVSARHMSHAAIHQQFTHPLTPPMPSSLCFSQVLRRLPPQGVQTEHGAKRYRPSYWQYVCSISGSRRNLNRRAGLQVQIFAWLCR